MFAIFYLRILRNEHVSVYNRRTDGHTYVFVPLRVCFSTFGTSPEAVRRLFGIKPGQNSNRYVHEKEFRIMNASEILIVAHLCPACFTSAVQHYVLTDLDVVLAGQSNTAGTRGEGHPSVHFAHNQWTTDCMWCVYR